MKAWTLIMPLFLAVTGSAHAATLNDNHVLATYSSIVVSDVVGQPALADVSLLDNGTLHIEKTIYAVPATSDQPVRKETLVTNVSPATLESLKSKMISVSDAAISTTHSDIVCMMMPLFGSNNLLQLRRGYDFQTNTFKGALTVVDNGNGCWKTTHINFAETYAQNVAHEIESALEVLTLEALR